MGNKKKIELYFWHTIKLHEIKLWQPTVIKDIDRVDVLLKNGRILKNRHIQDNTYLILEEGEDFTADDVEDLIVQDNS